MYDGWQQVWLDIDPAVQPDVLCDSREMHTLPPATYDAIYCSHNLEHYYRHDVKKVLAGFHHVLKDNGFVHIRVPDIGEVMRTFVKNDMDINDVLYVSAAGPITVQDVIYGWGLEIERSGHDFFAHKTGFTETSLIATLMEAEFYQIFSGQDSLEVYAIAFKDDPTQAQLDELGLN